ncbi:hypothetical protein CHS0354_036898 [Potamilus streckersoni]|uniref:Uncharacterized protein n=1 Tax=Potamilus streckersoni TaxID=2493646 RepID=A0AAE0RU23_9BIVA|nr:hypothetical protein CHS0354_036898 [Potamilus streckersoni]
MDEDRNEMEASQYRNAREYAQTLQGWISEYRFRAAMNFFRTQEMLTAYYDPRGQMQGANLWLSPVQHYGLRHRDSTAVNGNRQGTPNQAAGAVQQNDERQGNLQVYKDLIDFIL